MVCHRALHLDGVFDNRRAVFLAQPGELHLSVRHVIQAVQALQKHLKFAIVVQFLRPIGRDKEERAMLRHRQKRAFPQQVQAVRVCPVDVLDREHDWRDPRKKVKKLFDTEFRLIAFVARLAEFSDDKMRQEGDQIAV